MARLFGIGREEPDVMLGEVWSASTRLMQHCCNRIEVRNEIEITLQAR